MNGREKNDIFYAALAINLVPGLNGNSRRVAGALLQHYNRKTGQCDPSIERLSAILGIGHGSVSRATLALTQERFECSCVLMGTDIPFPLFKRDSNGGRSQRTAYTPIWSDFRKVIDEWNQLFKTPTSVLARIPKIESKHPVGTPPTMGDHLPQHWGPNL